MSVFEFLSDREFLLFLFSVVVGIPGTVASVPQAWKILKTKKAKDVSAGFIGLTMLSAFLWLSYGIVLGLGAIIFWNTFALVLLCITMALKIKYGKQ